MSDAPTQAGILPVATASSTRAHVRALLGGERLALGQVIVAQVLASGAGLVGPHVLGSILDGAGRPGESRTVELASLAFVVALLFQGLVTGYTSRLAAVLGERVLARLREGFVSDVLSLPLGVVERAGTGDLLVRASSDVDQLSFSVRRAAPEILIAALTAVLTVGALVWTAPVLAVALVPAVPIVVAGTRWYLRRAPAAYRAELVAYAKVNSLIQESVAAGRTIEAFGLGARRVERTDEAIGAWIGIERLTLGLRTRFFPVTEAAYVIPLVLTVFIGGLLHISGELSIGAVTAAGLYAQQLVNPVDVVLSWLDELQLGGASAARLLGVRDVRREETSEVEPTSQVVEASAVRYAYTPEQEALRGIDLTLNPGDRVAVVGPSGAGKSTLALLLAGVHSPSSGSVLIGGTHAHAIPTPRLREEVALVTQEHHIFSASIRDNLRLAAPDATDAELLAALETVEAGGLVVRLADGLDTVVGSGAAALSPAEAQQVALARLVLADPHTLVLDEATSLIDPKAARHLERSLARLLEGRTVVAVAHRLQSAADADVVVVVDEGRIVEHGSHGELLAAGGQYAALWRSWHGDPAA